MINPVEQEKYSNDFLKLVDSLAVVIRYTDLSLDDIHAALRVALEINEEKDKKWALDWIKEEKEKKYSHELMILKLLLEEASLD